MRITTLAATVCLSALLLPVSVAYPAGPGPDPDPDKKLSYADLAGRLIDLERLATLPTPGEKCMQWSSWDRRAQYDAKTGKYIHWGANGDGNGFIRKEGESLVLAEMDGPGCIWRIWSAKPEKGHVKIFLDGQDEPAVDIPFAAYFDGSTAPFDCKSLCYESARGKNCYVPIPFAKSCKVVAEKGWGRYYHFTYSVFPKGTQVDSFRMDLSAKGKAALAKADAYLRKHMGADPAGKRPGEETEGAVYGVEPGKSNTVLDLKGPRAITALRLDFPQVTSVRDGKDLLSTEEQRAILRELVLKITWDDEKTPAVWCPVGDFFGTAPGVNRYRSLPLGMPAGDEPYSLWYMPFAKRAKVELVNEGKRDLTVDVTFTHAPLTRPVGRYARFHAKWHRDVMPLPKDRYPDWMILKTSGRGRFVGVMLHVWNPKGGQYPPAGEGRYWWGEGDEKFFVDGEKYPSTFGTGSEDYFGYAWGNPTLFARAYHNQTISMGNRGHISVNRFHIADDVPFQKSFEGCIEKYFPNDWPTRYACTAYWYQAPGGKDPYGPAGLSERIGWYAKPKVFRVKGAVEGEGLKVLQRTGGRIRVQQLTQHGQEKWSENAHVWWTDAKPGDTLVLAVPVAKAGRYELRAQFTKAIDYGIVQMSVNGEKLGEPIDFFHDGVVPTGEVSLGKVDLSKGTAKLGAEITGANPKAKKAFMFGLDYVRLLLVK